MTLSLWELRGEGDMSSVNGVTRQAKGHERRNAIIEAAAALIREGGPAVVTHRAVAARAECSLSATTYYFSGLEELLTEAGKVNIRRWAERAERVADEIEAGGAPRTREETIDALLRACLPRDTSLITHYQQLLAVGGSAPVTAAYHAGRSRLDHALERVLRHTGCALPPDLVIAVVDGAAVTAISEHRDVLETARTLLGELIGDTVRSPETAEPAAG